jgi:hypothetical protein
MDAALTHACNWLADHRWTTCAILCAVCAFAGHLDVVLP